MSRQPPRPSRFTRVLLRLRPLGDRREDVEADLMELFDTRVSEHGLRHARRRYVVDVLSLWIRVPVQQRVDSRERPAWFSGTVADVMYAMRVFRRQAGVVSIAIAGLAVSIAMTTVVFAITNAFNFRPLGVPIRTPL